MPTYEYQCRTCKHQFEIFQKMADEPLTVCPECGGHIRRVLFPAGIVFKGSGFYKTDSAAKLAASEKGATKQSETAKSDAKSDAGSEAKTSSESKSTEGGGSSSSDASSSKPKESKVTAETK